VARTPKPLRRVFESPRAFERRARGKVRRVSDDHRRWSMSRLALTTLLRDERRALIASTRRKVPGGWL